ncbi:MAG: type II toxin-antitoxin system HicA family toxin [Planctomycetota bacterium]
MIRTPRRAGLASDEGGRHTIVFDPAGPTRHATIPRHRRIKTGTLRAILRQCGISVSRFLELYR